MTTHCCIRGCRVYGKKGKPETISFKFPANPALRKCWTLATRRPGFIPSKYSAICIRHFHPKYIEACGRHLKLKRSAVPSLHGMALRRMTDTELWGEEDVEEDENKEREKIEFLANVHEDCILSFAHFKEMAEEKLDLDNWVMFPMKNIVHFYTLDDCDSRAPVRIANSIEVFINMKMRLYIRELEQRSENLRWVLGNDETILRWSQFQTILARYRVAKRQKTAWRLKIDEQLRREALT